MNSVFNKKVMILILAVVVIVSLSVIVIFSDSGDSNQTGNNDNNYVNGDSPSTEIENTIVTEKETKLEEKKAMELYNLVPLMYTEEFEPFTDNFMLTAAMTKVLQEEEPNLSASHVDFVVEEIFGKGVVINKDNVSEMNIEKSPYYYYPETGSYCIVPVGMENMYMTQLLKYATKDDKYTYLYTNEINGAWHNEETKIVVVIGDKNGNDLVKSFDSYEDIEDYTIWQKEHSDMLPVVRYTLQEVDGKYILVGVEKVNY